MSASGQIPLGLQLRDSATFGNFVAGPNLEVVEHLRTGLSAASDAVYLWGDSGSGKTHLLQACCRDSHAAGRVASYLSLADSEIQSPEILEGLEQLSLVCLDEVDHVAGDAAWEAALFDLFNRMRAAGSTLCLAARRRADRAGFMLPDLVSRFNWGLVYGLRKLNDEQLAEALMMRAQGRGLELPPETVRYLLQRERREPARLFELLEMLDRASMAAQRRLTIPFVRSVLAQDVM